MSEHTPPSQADSIKETSEKNARRLLLKAMIYAPPMILGSMIVNPQLVRAAAQVDPPGTICPGGATVSCAPIGCCPCIANPLSKNCGDST
ncbi:MAG: hypothetical protein Q9M19_04700, partial [Mariprofundaceae bacterium]|nr:hypothetical protein [Mariprofundaceae bacterium]